RIAAETGLGQAVACSSCTAALHLALLALGVGAGDDALVADYSFPASAHSALFVGARPVFLDVRPDTYALDPAEISKAVTSNSKALIVVHPFGQMAEMDAVAAEARRFGLKIVEDAACAYGAADSRGRKPGELADVVCFSFHARKSATSGEGGALATRDEALAKRARSLTFFGIRPARERRDGAAFELPVFERLGYNYKLSDIQAAIVEVQLQRLPEMVAERRRLAARYTEALARVRGLTPPFVPPGARPVWQSYVVTLAGGVDRNGVIAAMRARGVECQIGTYAQHLQPVYADPRPCPVSADLFRRHLALPLFFGLSEAQQDRVVAALADVLEAGR
ncbi:MAG: DegT/DnrJ/EryC1/StrS family aminotransferase, partial [Myxococcales bacterium]